MINLKKQKALRKYLSKKVLKPPEAISMVQIDGWIPDPHDDGGSGHRQFVHPVKKGKVTIPVHSVEIDKYTVAEIKKQAGLI